MSDGITTATTCDTGAADTTGIAFPLRRQANRAAIEGWTIHAIGSTLGKNPVRRLLATPPAGDAPVAEAEVEHPTATSSLQGESGGGIGAPSRPGSMFDHGPHHQNHHGRGRTWVCPRRLGEPVSTTLATRRQRAVSSPLGHLPRGAKPRSRKHHRSTTPRCSARRSRTRDTSGGERPPSLAPDHGPSQSAQATQPRVRAPRTP